MFELLRKDFKLNLLWKTLEYKQLSMYECLDFSYLMKEKDFKLEDWIFNFLKDKINIKKTDIIKIDLSKFMEVMFNSAFKWFFNDWKTNKWSKWLPFEAYVMFLSNSFNLHPDKLLKSYTPEQISYYLNWIIYNLNEQTEKWQRINKTNIAMEEIRKEDPKKVLQRIKEMEEKLKLKHNKK